MVYGNEDALASDVNTISIQQRMPKPIAPTIAIRVTLGNSENRFLMFLTPSHDCNTYSNIQENAFVENVTRTLRIVIKRQPPWYLQGGCLLGEVVC